VSVGSTRYGDACADHLTHYGRGAAVVLHPTTATCR